MSDQEIEDPRFGHIKNTVLKLLDVHDNHWAELIWKEDNQAIIKDFLDTPTNIVLLIFLDQNEKLFLSLEMPSLRYIPSSMGYFLKNCPIVSEKNFKSEITFGNIFNLPLCQYQLLFEKVFKVFYPVFSNPNNNSRWPDEITSDIILHLEDFRKTLTYYVSLAQGKTVLVVPEQAKVIENFNVDEITSDHGDWKLHDVINAITDMLSDWIPVIKEVLDVTSESILLKVQQGPESEIAFWNDRKSNLEFIQQQLNDPVIEKMVLALEKVNDYHFTLFKNLLQEVLEALSEANEISDSLSAMSNELKKLEKSEFFYLKEALPEAIKIITSSWTDSKYFNKVPSRICILIKKACYFLIEKVEKYIIPSELFKGNESEIREKVKMSIETCNVFLEAYAECRENFSQDSKIYPWEFPDQRVFQDFDIFLQRLNKVNEIFEASALYCSIPNYKIFGVQQVPFKRRLDELSATFTEHYKVFFESSYNPLSWESDAFIKDYNLFSLKLEKLDRKLGRTLSQACLSCITSEDSLKLMNLIRELLKRPLVNLEFKKMIASLFRNIYTELLAAKDCYENLLLHLESNDQVIYKNLSSVSGELQWCLDLQRKLSFPVDSIQQLQSYYINADDADLILRSFKEMEEVLKNFQQKIFNKEKTALDLAKTQLDESLFLTDENDNLVLNFSPQILYIAEEIQYIKTIKKDNLLSADALEFHGLSKKILLSYSLLACTIQWYNDLTQNLIDLEKMLIKDEWENVCEDLKKGLEEKWTKNDLQEYAEKLYEIVKSLHEKINKSKENIREVEQFINTWNNFPVFTRSSPDSLVNFQVLMTAKMRQQIYNVIETAINMDRVMEENLLLFEIDPKSDEWKNYVQYLDLIIEDGLKASINCSLQYLVVNTDGQNKKLKPFYQIRIILEEDITFVPLLDRHKEGSLFTLFDAMVENIYAPASQIKRLANPEEDYLETIAKDVSLNELKTQIIQHMNSGVDKIWIQKRVYENYSDLWIKDINAVLEDFILYGPLPDIKAGEEEDIADVLLELKSPTEEEFRAQIAQFQLLQKKIEEIPSEMLIESWLILDATSFKESLLLLIRKWSSAYKKKLVELKSQGKLREVEDDGD